MEMLKERLIGLIQYVVSFVISGKPEVKNESQAVPLSVADSRLVIVPAGYTPDTSEPIGKYEVTEGLASHGEERLRSGKPVGVVILSGGDGSRLGLFGKPKGLYKLGEGTLFDIHLQRLKNVFEKYSSTLPIYLFVMTSENNHKEVEDFFESKRKDWETYLKGVSLFKQNMLPVLDKVTQEPILDYSERNGAGVLKAPAGNGDIFRAIVKAEHFIDVEFFHVTSVDNVLAKLLDEESVGAFVNLKLEILSKGVITKGKEKMGTFSKVGKKVIVREYSDVALKGAEFYIGNICNHIFSREYIKKVCDEEKSEELSGTPLSGNYNKIKKEVKYVNRQGEEKRIEAIKREKYIFDRFDLASEEKNAVILVGRKNEFCPLKSMDDVGLCKSALEQEKKREYSINGTNPVLNGSFTTSSDNQNEEKDSLKDTLKEVSEEEKSRPDDNHRPSFALA